MQVLYVVKDAESAWVLDKRSKFQEVLNDAKAGKFRVMIVDKMDRFTRSEDLSEYMAVMTELAQAGVEPIYVQRDYERTATGRLQQFLDAYVSAQEQANRRQRIVNGKRGRVITHKRPLPGHKAPFGYRWLKTEEGQAKKTRLEKTDDAARETVERIWRYFLTDAAPAMRGIAMRGIAMQLNRDHVAPPRLQQGILGAKDRWYPSAIQAICTTASTGESRWRSPRASMMSRWRSRRTDQRT